MQAIAVANEHSNSAVAFGSYSVLPPPITATPVFNPRSGPITNGTPVSISCSTTGATIYYALNQNPLTTNSPTYTGPLILNGPVTVRAMATAYHYGDSQIAGSQYSFLNSPLAIDPTSLISNGQIQIRWQTAAGKSYVVQYSTNLTAWNDLGSPIQGDGSVASVIDPTPIADKRFYRVRTN